MFLYGVIQNLIQSTDTIKGTNSMQMMDNNDERVTKRARVFMDAGIADFSKDEIILYFSSLLVENDDAIAQAADALQQNERYNILDFAVERNWTFDQLMENIDRLEFPNLEYSDAYFEPQPRESSVATPKSVGAAFHLDMSRFQYPMLTFPGRCSWKQVNLPSSMHDFVCTTLFGSDTAIFDETLTTYGAYLGKLRDVYGYRRHNSGRVDENNHFRPTFTLWLGHLLNAISSSWEVEVKNLSTGVLSFAANLKVEGMPDSVLTDVRGHEDVLILHNHRVQIIGEYKTPFSAMWPSQEAQTLYHAALSQMYAEMQGFIRTPPHTSSIPTTMAETAAAITTVSSEGSISENKLWYVSFLTDGFALRVSLASKPSTGDDQELPTVYTSSNTRFLDTGIFTETILYMLAVTMTNDPLIDVAASSDFNEATVHSTLPANDGPSVNGPGAGGPSHRSPSYPTRSPQHAVGEGGDEDCELDNADRFVVTWNDDYLQFLEAEEEEVDRLNSLLAASFGKEGRLSKHALKTLGTRSLVI